MRALSSAQKPIVDETTTTVNDWSENDETLSLGRDRYQIVNSCLPADGDYQINKRLLIETFHVEKNRSNFLLRFSFVDGRCRWKNSGRRFGSIDRFLRIIRTSFWSFTRLSIDQCHCVLSSHHVTISFASIVRFFFVFEMKKRRVFFLFQRIYRRKFDDRSSSS